jgi:hypothetical protein
LRLSGRLTRFEIGEAIPEGTATENFLDSEVRESTRGISPPDERHSRNFALARCFTTLLLTCLGGRFVTDGQRYLSPEPFGTRFRSNQTVLSVKKHFWLVSVYPTARPELWDELA